MFFLDSDSRLLNTRKFLSCLMQLISTKLRIQKRGRKRITPVAMETLWNHFEALKREVKELTDLFNDLNEKVEILKRT